ncbi:ulp1 protease family, C-terminal catalytic domain-containing protein [Tanacetum coccineum]
MHYNSTVIPLFKCKWVDNEKGVNVDEDGFTTVNLSTNGYKSEPFILAKLATQVFYVKDPNDQRLHVILYSKRHIVGVENVEDEDEYHQFNELPPFSVGITPSNDVLDHTTYLRSDHDEGLEDDNELALVDPPKRKKEDQPNLRKNLLNRLMWSLTKNGRAIGRSGYRGMDVDFSKVELDEALKEKILNITYKKMAQGLIPKEKGVDPLIVVLRPEHGGYTRTVRDGIGFRKGIKGYKQSKKGTKALKKLKRLLIEIWLKEMQKEIKKRDAQRDDKRDAARDVELEVESENVEREASNEGRLQKICKQSSCESTTIVHQEQLKDMKEPKSCMLFSPYTEDKKPIARGMVYPIGDGTVHEGPLIPYYMKVSIDSFVPAFGGTKLPVSSKADDTNTLKQQCVQDAYTRWTSRDDDTADHVFEVPGGMIIGQEDTFNVPISTEDIMKLWNLDGLNSSILLCFENKMEEPADMWKTEILVSRKMAHGKDKIYFDQTCSESFCRFGGSSRSFPRWKRSKKRDLISPYLFTIVMEVLNLIIQRQIVQKGNFKYHSGCEEFKITNLYSANNLLILSNGDCESVKVIKLALEEFSLTSGLVLNLGKSTMFYSNINEDLKNEILEIVPFVVGKLLVRYLGVPLVTKSLKVKDYLLGISVFFPKTIINEIKSILKGFLWGQSEKAYGKARVAWKNVKWVSIYKLKGRSLWEIDTDDNASWGWKRVMELRNQVRPYIRHCLGNGENTSIWHDYYSEARPIDKLVSRRHIYSAGFENNATVASMAQIGQNSLPDD